MAYALKLKDTECDGNEESLEQCQDFNVVPGDIDDGIALTCFHYDIFGNFPNTCSNKFIFKESYIYIVRTFCILVVTVY